MSDLRETVPTGNNGNSYVITRRLVISALRLNGVFSVGEKKCSGLYQRRCAQTACLRRIYAGQHREREVLRIGCRVRSLTPRRTLPTFITVNPSTARSISRNNVTSDHVSAVVNQTVCVNGSLPRPGIHRKLINAKTITGFIT